MAPYITLTEANARFTAMSVNMRKGQNKSLEYLKLNPKHKVPLLVVDGEPLTESAAIQLWIAQAFPEAHLMPADPWQALKAVSMLSWCASGIHPYLSRINSPAKVCDQPGAEESVSRLAAEFVFESFQLADGLLAGREYFFDHFTAPDAHFFWCFRRAGQFGLDLSGFKNCGAHFERMQTRTSVQKLLAFEKEVQAQFANAA
ncbi:MAG: glutathione S-transferase [Alphaproteobacteria bacterium]